MERGYWFEWRPWETPRLWKPNGTEILLVVRGNVPYIVENLEAMAMPVELAHVNPHVQIPPPEAPAGGEEELDDADEEGGVIAAKQDRIKEANSLQHLTTHMPKRP